MAFAGGGYVSLGIGQSHLSGELDNRFSDSGSDAVRFSAGQRFGSIALEASLFGSDFAGDSATTGTGSHNTLSLGVDLKYYFFGLGPLELFGRAGLNRTWLHARDSSLDERHQGNGWDIGLGAQLGIDLPMAQMALWGDLTHQQTDLRYPGEPSFDGGIQTAMAGVSVGF